MGLGNLLSAERRRDCDVQIQQKRDVSERRACDVLDVSPVQHYMPCGKQDEEALRGDIIRLVGQLDDMVTSSVTALLKAEGGGSIIKG